MADADPSSDGARPCPGCGTDVPAGFRFCGRCGGRLHRPDVDAGGGTAPREDRAEGPAVAAVPASRTSRRRRVLAAALVVAVAVGGVVVLRAVDVPAPLTAAARGDAGGTGVYADPGDVDLQHRRWRDRWTQAAPRDRLPSIRPVPIDDGYLVAVEGVVARLDAATGAVRWRVELDVDGLSPPLPVDGRFIVVPGRDELTLLDVVDGTRLWSAEVPELAGRRGVASAGRTLAVTGENGSIVLIDLVRGTRTATLLARDVLGERGPFTSDLGPVAVGDGIVVHLRRSLQESGVMVMLDQAGRVRWVSEERVRPWTPPVVGDDDRSIVVGTDDGIVALDAVDGSRRWRWLAAAGEDAAQLRATAVTPDGRRVLVTSAWPVRRVLDASNGTLIVSENAEALQPEIGGVVTPAWRIAAATAAGTVEVIDVTNGRTLASAAAPGGVPGQVALLGHPELAQDQIVTGLPGGVVTARPLGGGAQGWTAAVTPGAACEVVAGADAVLVAGGALRALDAGDGARRWTAVADLAPVGQVAASDGTVLSVDQAGFGTATDAATGEERWRVPVGGQSLGGPVASGDVAVFAGGTGIGGTSAGYLRALALEDGSRRWFQRTHGRLAYPPAVADGLVVAATSGSLQGFDLGTGEERWRLPLASPPSAPPVLAGGRVVVTTADDVTTYLLTPDGPVETARTAPAVPLRRSPAVTADTIVVRLDARTVVALDLDGHAERWRSRVDDDVLTTPPSVAGERVLVGGRSGVHVLDLANGRRSEVVGTGPLVGHIGVTDHGIVTCGADGELLAHG